MAEGKKNWIKKGASKASEVRPAAPRKRLYTLYDHPASRNK